MAEITKRRTGELLRKLFEILLTKPEGMQAKDALVALEKAVELTPYESGSYASGRRFEKIVRFATLDTSKAGWLTKSKGQWSVTDAGKLALKSFSDPEAFYREACRLYAAWKRAQLAPDDNDTVAEVENGEAVSERSVSQTFDESEERAWQEIEKVR